MATRIKSICKELGIRPDLIRRLSIANFEAEMNVIMYADEAELELPGPARGGPGRAWRTAVRGSPTSSWP